MVALLASLPCKMDEDGHCRSRSLEWKLSSDTMLVDARINANLGDLLSISFPKPLQIRDVQNGNEAIFKVEQNEDTILVRPQVPPGAAESARKQGIPVAKLLLKARGNLQITLKQGWRINLDMRLWYPSESVRAIQFSSDDAKKWDLFIEAETKRRLEAKIADLAEIEEALKKRQSTAIRAWTAEQILSEAECDNENETAMSGLLWAQWTTKCRLGEHVFLAGEIRNRSRSKRFRPMEITLDANDAPIQGSSLLLTKDGSTVKLQDLNLGFDEHIKFVVAFDASYDGDIRLTVADSGDRMVVIED